ncbi:uncharacterized protein V6R79_007653 [Siganus canaliculatus]
MSGRQNVDNLETLFSFELLVEYIAVEKEGTVSDELAVGVRLLDFPTLLIYQPQQSSDGISQQHHNGTLQHGKHPFNRGKSCFFKMNLNSLHNQLSNSPLYAMVLDVKDEIPKLIGTSLVSLAKIMDKIQQDVTEHGTSAPSSHGERGMVSTYNLKGEKIGSISLSYKLLSLGVSLLPHVVDSRNLTSVHVEEHACQSIVEKSTLGKSDVIADEKPSDVKTVIDEDKHNSGVCVEMQTEEPDRSLDEDFGIFCPPHLFYSNSENEKSMSDGGGCRLLNLVSEALDFEDTVSEEEVDEKVEETCSTVIDSRVRHKEKTSQQTSGTTVNVLGEALQQLPLLNALLVELSQLNSHSPQQQLSIHPNLAWIYRPASTEPSAEHGNTGQKTQKKSLQKTRQENSPHLKPFHSPRNCSTPVVQPASVTEEKCLTERQNSSMSARKKLVYGTTKTFNLRLQRVSPLKAKRCECVESTQTETQSGQIKGKTKPSNKILKSSSIKSASNQTSSQNVNIATKIENIRVESALQETLKQKKRDSLRFIENSSPSEGDLGSIQIPSVNCDKFSQNKDKTEHHSESNQSQSEPDRHRHKTKSSGSSRHSSPKSFLSDSSRDRNDEADYADDFTSLEPSDAYSPDPASSPEASRAKTPWSPVRNDVCNSDSGSEGVQRRAILPVPIKAPGSPQRALRGTHIIRPRTQASALSFSSDEGDRSNSLQTICSRKPMTESGRVEKSSYTDSLKSSRGRRSNSSRNSGPVQGLSAESVSSFEPQELEELEDELGSLDFRKEYQHISKLVSNKLPGYTM